MKKLIFVLLTISLFSGSGYSYGSRGHHLVGAIADRRLAKNEAVATKVSDLLDGLTLERAATLPDDIKGWAECGDSPSKVGARGKRSRPRNELTASCGLS